MFVSLCRDHSNILFGRVSGCGNAPQQRLEAFCGRIMHLGWCNCVSILSSGNSSGLKSYIDSPICCAVENTPQEIVFSLLTPLVRDARVSSTCAAVPFGEVRSRSRVPACRLSIGRDRNRTAKFGRTSQPLAMLCAAQSDLRAARGPLQPIGRRLFQSAGADDRQPRCSRIEPVDRCGG
jgi:hypothetical protein